MKILYLIESLTNKSNGVNTLVFQLADSLKVKNHSVRIVASSKLTGGIEKSKEMILFEPNLFMNSWLFSKDLKNIIEHQILDFKPDVIHLHGYWMAPQLIGAILAKKYKIPSILSTHGMLDRWLWSNQGIFNWLKKTLYDRLFARRIFQDISYLHAITHEEEIILNQIFPENKSILIPNGINVKKLNSLQVIQKQTILFLGRIHPIKNIETLIKSFQKVKAQTNLEWRLVIAGPFVDKKYKRLLEKLVKSLAIEDCVNFIGEINGKEKEEIIQKAWVLVLPSFNEVIGMVNLEAALFFTPSITTNKAGLSNWEQGGGLLIQPTIESLSKALMKAFQWSDLERIERGKRINKFVKLNYNIKILSKTWTEKYQQIIAKKKK